MLINCPECGHPINGENTCPACGFPMGNQSNQSEFNETKPYSPLSKDAWIFKTPFPLNKYPRGVFGKKHPFCGWFFGPFHIVNKGGEDSEYYNVINNILYICNLVCKFNVYVALWWFLKLWWFVLLEILIVVLCCEARFEELAVAIAFVCLLCEVLVFFCGMLAAISRYVPAIIRTFRRIFKRHWISMYKAVKTDNLNLD